MNEEAIKISCENSILCGILHQTSDKKSRGVLIVVGGPQYRVGSHRQFVFLARKLSAAGYPTLRFDYRGMGDSEGDPRTFEEIGLDIRAAVDELCERAGVHEVVICGLCDAASAALFYSCNDPRVAGLVLLNPWVRTEESLAETYVRHYYLSRVLSRDFWSKVLSGRVNVTKAAGSFLGNLKAAAASSAASRGAKSAVESAPSRDAPLPERMAYSFEQFPGPVLVILSGQDLTAKEFEEACRRSPQWHSLLGRANVSVQREAEADHTFSRAAWRGRVEDTTVGWLRSW